MLHYKLHLHIANQNWTEIRQILEQVLATLQMDMKRFLHKGNTNPAQPVTGHANVDSTSHSKKT